MKEKSIVVLHSHNTFNNGSFMMLINFIAQIQKQIPSDGQLTIWVELDGDDNKSRFEEALESVIKTSKNLIINYLPLKITSPENIPIFKRLVNLYKKFFDHHKFYTNKGISTIIVLGGDDISEYYKGWMIISDLIRLYLYSKKFTVILAGQSIGPFKGFKRLLATFCLSHCIIFNRDSISTEYVKQKLHHKPALTFDSADLAFPDLPNQNGTEALRKYNLTPGQYISIVPGGFYSLYTRNRKNYLLTWQYFIGELKSYPALQAKQLVFLPHVTRPEDDRSIIADFKSVIFSRIPHIYIEDELMPNQLRQILGNGYLTITSRLHASISTFQMLKPAIAIGFSTKYEGVIGRSIKSPELTIHSIEALFEKPDIFSHEVMRAIEYATENYDDIVYKLSIRIPELKKIAISQINSIITIIFQD